MLKLTGTLTTKKGLPPGTPVFVGEKKTEHVKMTVIDYDEEHLETRVAQTVEECFPFKEKPTITWINVDGIHDTVIVEQLGTHYGLHPLIIEDMLNTQQRLKVDVFDDYILIVLKMHIYDEEADEILIEQVSIILGENFVLTFQEQEGDVFESIRTRLQNDKGRIRKAGADYLAYALIDAVVDGYFEIIEHLGEQIEVVEEDLMRGRGAEIVQNIHVLKRELIFFRKSVWPLRNMISELDRQEIPLIKESTSIYLRDLYDHIIQVGETIETFRDMVSGLLDVYLSSVSNKMNEVMQFLTIVGTIFIPLTFIAGIYGMNFQVMPELTWRWGYFAVLFLMLGIGVTLLFYFRRKKWL